MASYSINVVDTNGAGGGPFTVSIFRNPTTAASGGTAVTIPFVENNNNGGVAGVGATQSTNQYTALQAAVRAMFNDRAANGD